MIDDRSTKIDNTLGNGGFSLIETLIYITLFTTVIVFVIASFYQLIDSQNRNRARIETETEGNFVMQKISWALNSLQTINQPAVGATSTTLSVNRYNFAQNPLVFDIASSVVRLSRAALEPIPLTSSNVRVGQLLFAHVSSTATQPEAVQITLNLSSNITDLNKQASNTITTTIYLRK